MTMSRSCKLYAVCCLPHSWLILVLIPFSIYLVFLDHLVLPLDSWKPLLLLKMSNSACPNVMFWHPFWLKCSLKAPLTMHYSEPEGRKLPSLGLCYFVVLFNKQHAFSQSPPTRWQKCAGKCTRERKVTDMVLISSQSLSFLTLSNKAQIPPQKIPTLFPPNVAYLDTYSQYFTTQTSKKASKPQLWVIIHFQLNLPPPRERELCH